MNDEDLAKRFEEYQKLARENPGVDVHMLMLNDLQKQTALGGAGKSYKWPYLIALGVPPLGLLYTLKYYMNGDEQDRQAGRICALLTAVSFILAFAFGKAVFSSSGTSVEQIQQIKVKDIQELNQ